MAKKGFGKLVVFAAVAGATAAGISYLKKYKSFNDELEEEFHDFECGEEDDDDLFEEEEVVSIMEEEPEVHHEEPEETAEASKEPDTEKDGEANSRASRKYIPLNVSKDELKLAAKDMVTAAGEIAGAAKSVLKDAAVILSESAHEAAVVAKDTAHIARAKLNERAEYHRNRQQEEAASADETPEPSTVSEQNVPVHQTQRITLLSPQKRLKHLLKKVSRKKPGTKRRQHSLSPKHHPELPA